MSLHSRDREIAIGVLAEAGAKMSTNQLELLDDNQLAEALVWADSVQAGTPVERPRFIETLWDKSVRTEALVRGRTIKSVAQVDDDVVLELDRGKLTLRLTADCCSTSYFADVKQFDPLVGATIFDLEERDLGEVENPESECTKAHCLVFTTNRGHETIDWRNDSNGYYDGTVIMTVGGES